MSLIVKVCGITRVEDGLAAIEAGADWLGFIRWPGSSRYRELKDCAETLAQLREELATPFEAVGVYVDADAATIDAELAAAKFNRVQLHGDEPMALIQLLSVPAIKTLKIRDADSVRRAEDYPDVDLLTDTAHASMPGGTGEGYDLSLLGDLASRRRVIVAGGLRPDNVGELIAALHPFGVDVSSGVESEPGIKDRDKLRAFVAAARAASSSPSA